MRMNHLLLGAGMAVMLGLGASQLMAQNNPGGPGGGAGGMGGPGGGRGPGNWDPAQFQQRMMERYKETLEITDDTEWKAIQPLVQKVMDAQMAVGFGRPPMGRGPRPGGDSQRPNFGPANPEADNLQRAIDSKASGAEMKAALQKYLDSRKEKRANLEKAQADLRKVLTPRQEAIASLMNLL